MPNTKGVSTYNKKSSEDNFDSDFVYITDISKFNTIANFENIKLCIITAEIKKELESKIGSVIKNNKQTEFWISTNNSSRKEILIANKMGIKNVVSNPIDEKLIIDFLNRNNIEYIKAQSAPAHDYLSLNGLNVMIVDDNSINIELLEEILSGLDLKITSFTKPKEAALAIVKNKFDLFLLDVMMPELSGFELAEIIKETSHHQNTPIIFISALSDTQNKIKSYELGSYAYVEKPFDINIIKAQIYNVLKNNKIKELQNENKEIFLATVAHDLKTPISAEISVLTQLLNNNFGELEPSQQEIVQEILNSTRFMQSMVENFLSKNKIESGQINLSKEVYSIKEIAERCINITKYILQEKKQKISLKCSAQNTLIPVDFIEMKRALHNLIANASAYSPVGANIIIELQNQENNMIISVQDFGKGIALERQKDVFGQYMSFAKEHKTVGSGLGLYITKSIVEAHGGEILLDSRVGHGTKISMVLPMYTKV